MSFSQFLQELSKNNLLKRNLHWRPQVDLLVYKEYDDIFCVENLLEAKTILKNKIDLDIVDARGYTGHGKDHFERTDDQIYSNASVSELRVLLDSGLVPSTTSFYSPICIDVVKNLYHEDIEYYYQFIGRSQLMEQFDIVA